MRWHETDTERASEAVRSVWELNTMMFWVHREKICQRCWLRRYLTNFGSFYTRTGQWLLFRSRSILKKKKERKKRKRSLAVYSRSSQKCASRLSTCQVLTVIVRVVRAAGIVRMSVCLPGAQRCQWFLRLKQIYSGSSFFFFWGCAWHHLFSSSSFAPSSSP